MVQAGMPPMFCLQAATSMRRNFSGTRRTWARVTPGKIADVVAVPGDPIADISLMKQVSFVMKDGTVYKLNSTAVEFDGGAPEGAF